MLSSLCQQTNGVDLTVSVALVSVDVKLRRLINKDITYDSDRSVEGKEVMVLL